MIALTMSACGGGGGGSNPVPPTPSLTLTGSPTNVSSGGTSTLTWNAANVTSCTASGGWAGSRSTSGSEQVGPLDQTTTFNLDCTGDRGSVSRSVTVTVGAATSVTVSGKITFDRVPFSTTLGNGLDFSNVVQAPAREVVVEALEGTTIRASTSTNASGDYALPVPANLDIRIRAKAQMLKSGAAPTWNFRVLNNTNGDALYVLDSAVFNSGSSNVTRNLHAASGWGTTSYTGNRSAAPFAILDTIYEARELVRGASGSQSFQSLNLFWSPQNRPAEPFCPDTGDIGTTSYVAGQTECSGNSLAPAGIYVLGDASGDTDEFDQHVIAHEFGHYFEDVFGRSDSIGGQHGLGERLDLRVAFSEGWGNAFAAMVLGDPLYRDSAFGVGDASFDIESDSFGAAGWYNESSVHQILWDIFDSGTESGDDLALGFGPIFNVLSGGQRNTEALTSIFSFGTLLKAAQSGSVSAINSLLSGQSIAGVGMDEFGSTETNNAGSVDVLPVYTDIGLNQQVEVCGIRTFGTYNKLSNRRFLSLDLSGLGTARQISITVKGILGPDVRDPDPDLLIWRRGELWAISQDLGTDEVFTGMFDPRVHVLEVYECTHVLEPQQCLEGSSNIRRGRTCMTVSVTG